MDRDDETVEPKLSQPQKDPQWPWCLRNIELQDKNKKKFILQLANFVLKKKWKLESRKIRMNAMKWVWTTHRSQSTRIRSSRQVDHSNMPHCWWRTNYADYNTPSLMCCTSQAQIGKGDESSLQPWSARWREFTWDDFIGYCPHDTDKIGSVGVFLSQDKNRRWNSP